LFEDGRFREGSNAGSSGRSSQRLLASGRKDRLRTFKTRVREIGGRKGNLLSDDLEDVLHGTKRGRKWFQFFCKGYGRSRKRSFAGVANHGKKERLKVKRREGQQRRFVPK